MKKMCEINGVRYITPKVFADCCDCSAQKITAACKDGRIIGAYKDMKNNWMIPCDALKPLELETIRKLMVATLYLKNNPGKEIGNIEHDVIIRLYDYLFQCGYINQFEHESKRIPYEVVLTEKGFKVATEGKKVNINWLNIGVSLIQVAASVITVVQVVI